MSGDATGQHLSPEQLYEDHGYKVIIVSCVLAVLCTVAVLARFFAVRKKEAKLWWDDWLCIPSLVSGTLEISSTCN